MAKRLQVIMQDPDYREIQRVARSRHMSIAEWVRQALDHARRREPWAPSEKSSKLSKGRPDMTILSVISTACWPRSRQDTEPVQFVILVDSNIPMYLVGAPDPHKSDAQRLLEKLVTDRQPLVTDAEVFQEILHRYVAIDRRDAIQPAFDALLGMGDEVLAIDRHGGAACEADCARVSTVVCP